MNNTIDTSDPMRLLKDSSPTPFFNKQDTTKVSFGHLPHWSQYKKIYAVTFRLHDSLPLKVLKAFQKQCVEMIGEEIHNFKSKRDVLLQKKMMEYMDAGYGECLLRHKDIRNIVEAAFEYISQTNVRVHAFVIMPNHVHCVLETLNEAEIQNVMHSIKGFTGTRINAYLHRKGCVWQREYYDRIIRTPNHYANTILYILSNPRNCKEGEYSLGGEIFTK